MSHHLDRPIASDASYFVFQKRRELGELGLSGADCTSQKLYPVPSFVAKRRQFIADPEFGNVSDDAVMDLTLGHYRPARKG